MQIHEIANQSGIPVSTLRYWEKKGLIPAQYLHRGTNNHRVYSHQILAHLNDVQLFIAAGFSLKQLAALYQHSLELSPEERHTILFQQKQSIDQQLTQLGKAKNILEQMLQADWSRIKDTNNWQC